jgi:hypothetical protein
MKLLTISLTTVLSSFLTTGYGQQSIPFNDKRWVIESEGKMLEPFKGYNSLYLQNGHATLTAEKFLNGIIEFDIYMQQQTSFSGLFFRMTSPGNYEDLYLRPHQSGRPDAYQYTPVFNDDPAWQLYHDQHDGINDGFIHWKPDAPLMGYNTVLDLSFDSWTHVKLLVKGTQAELYINNNPQPAAFIRELMRGQQAGSLGLSSSIGACWFANFSFTETDDVTFKTKDDGYKIKTPAGTITQWQVSNTFKEDVLKNTNQLDTKWLSRLQWKSLDAEATGITNLSRLSAIKDTMNTVLTKIVIQSDKEQLKKIDIGYSDRVRVYCNGQILYSGNTAFRTRDYRYLGTIGYFDAVYLPLKKGENSIILAISENFGGWGVMGKMEDREGVRIVNGQ